MCIFEWAEVSIRAKCWFSFIQMEGSEANCSYWGKGGCRYTSLISANLSDGYFLFLFEIVLFPRAVWLLMLSVEVWLGLWRSVGLLFWHGGWYIYRSAGAKASSISERREGGSFPHYLLSISAADRQMCLWKCNPHRLQGRLARTGWKWNVWSVSLTSLFQTGMMLDVLFCVSFQIKHNCLALVVEQLCARYGACLVINFPLQHISHNNNEANTKCSLKYYPCIVMLY